VQLSYPRLRVFIAFLFCPALVTTFLLLLFVLLSLFDMTSYQIQFTGVKDVLFSSLIFIFLAVAFSLSSVCSYLLQSLIVSAIYLKLRPYRNKRGLLVVTSVGAVFAFISGFFFLSGSFFYLPELFTQSFWEDPFLYSAIGFAVFFMLLMSASYFLMGLMVLPKTDLKTGDSDNDSFNFKLSDL